MHAELILFRILVWGDPRDFLNHAENAAWRGFPYDWVILLGGWNSDVIPCEEVSILFGDLFEYCNDNLIRQWLFRDK